MPIVTVTAGDVLASNFALPAYAAVIEFEPVGIAEVVSVALPSESVPGPRSVVPAKNSTVPSGVSDATFEDTVAVSSTGLPGVVVAGEAVSAVIVSARATVT